MVGFSLVKADDKTGAAANGNTLNPALPESWIEIHADNTVLIRAGKPDFGQSSVFTAYRQIAADELRVPFEAITTVISGDTDRTPDGSGAFDFLQGGMPNIRKAGAYVYQALLDLGSERLGVPKDQLSVKDGVISGGGKPASGRASDSRRGSGNHDNASIRFITHLFQVPFAQSKCRNAIEKRILTQTPER